MKRLLVRSAIVGILLALIGGSLFYAVLRMSLPQLDGEIAVAGLSAAVTIERDAGGIPVITASNRVDLAFATGYVHGQDRFFQMDLTRRNAAGELAELFGPAALDVDRRHRFHRFRTRANAVIGTLTPSQDAILDAYARGVNAGLADLGAKPFEYLLTGTEPRPWQKTDSLLAVFTMYMQLNDERATRDVRRGLAHQVLPEAVFTWLYPQGTPWDAPLDGEPRETADFPAADIYALNGTLAAQVRLPYYADGDPVVPGSNNWAVSGALTESGAAIVANDMHLGITTPNVFYRARLRTTDRHRIDLNGVFLPGAPILVAGSNGRVAWGNTNSYGDWSDAVIIRPGPSDETYMTPDGPREFDVIVERIAVKDEEPVEMEIRETIWGPVLDDNPDPDRTIAVSWIAHHSEGVTLNHLNLETASSVEEALRIANTIGMPPQNFVAGDAAGNIGWTIAGRIPVRKGYNPLLPADWSGDAGWHGWLDPVDYPRIVNPASGRIWTANARVVDGEALRIIGDGGYDLGARARQIRDGLFDIDRFAPADMLTVQLDDRAVFMSPWRELLLETLDGEAVNGSESREEYRQLVEEWLPRASTDSVGYRLVRRFRSEVRNRAFTMLMQPVLETYGEDTELRISQQFEGPLWSLVTQRPAHLLTDNYQSWEDLLVQAVDSSIEYFEENYEDGLERRTWGERNTARIQHPLSRALPILSPWLDMPADELPGDSNLPRAQGQTWGASERFAVSPGSEADGYLHMPAGQSGHPLSEFYRIGHDAWVGGLPSPFLPGTAKHTLVLKPAG
jgi:penicillin amidase